MTALLLTLLATGCARFNTTQTEVRDETQTTIETKATAWTFLAGKSALANWEAGQSEGEQKASVGKLDQESDASNLAIGLTTNVVEAVVRAAIGATVIP